MILWTRVLARDFRTLFARCVAGRPRGPAPPVVVEVKSGVRTRWATTPAGVILTHSAPADGERDERVVLPAEILAETEGGTEEPVTLDRPTKLQGLVHWQDGSQSRTQPVDLILPGRQHEIPVLPALALVSAKLLAALHECGRTAARESGRYALSKVQLQGKAGRVIGTDGKVALIGNGFDFPFTDNLLVPAVPVFGAKPLSRVSDVQIGSTATHVVVAVGPWGVWLPFDTKAKYPDVAAVIPRHAPTTVTLDSSDAAELLTLLPTLLGQEHELRPVTLDAHETVRVRGYSASDEPMSSTKDDLLRRSSVTGPAVRLAFDRRVLARILTLGCYTLKLTPNKPLVARGEDFLLIAAPLDPALLALSTSATPETDTPPHSVTSTPIPHSERSDPVKPSEPDSHAPARDEASDPLIAAEELRAALSEVLTKANRLVAALKHAKKEKKALAHVWAGLKQLNLDTGDPR